MTTPNWFNSRPDDSLEEDELRERLEYDKAQLEILEMDVANAKLRVRRGKYWLGISDLC